MVLERKKQGTNTSGKDKTAKKNMVATKSPKKKIGSNNKDNTYLNNKWACHN